MTKEELKTATDEEVIDDLDYCGYDSYYDGYRDNIIEEIKKRMKKASVLDKAKEEIEKHRRKTKSIDSYDLVGDCLEIINECEKESEEKE